MQEPITSYTISPSNDSTLAVEISRTGLRRHKKDTVFFDQFSGEMCFAENDPAAFKITLTIDASSVVCRDPWLTGKKRRKVADFARHEALMADAHPEIRFDSKSICAKPLRGFVVEGTLRIRDATRMVKVNAVLGSMRKDAIQVGGDTTLRLSDFGLPRRSALFGLMGAEDEVAVRLLLWAIPRTEVTAPTGENS